MHCLDEVDAKVVGKFGQVDGDVSDFVGDFFAVVLDVLLDFLLILPLKMFEELGGAPISGEIP